jgi:anti-sigma B factor antagonist
MAATPRISLSEDDGVPVIRFLDRQLFDDSTVREVADQLFEALPRGGSPIALIVDFSGVDLVSSAMLGKLILLQRRVDSSGGKLRFCELNHTILGVLKTTNLERLFGIDRDRREAREAFGPVRKR